MKKITLVIMAAGIGSRFGGGIKQLEPIGPNGEIIMDYSIQDAMAAGFNDVVFVISHRIEETFKKVIGSRIEKKVPVRYAFQELEDLPMGISKPKKREKPWGTGQAVLAVKNMVNNPFAVINADDFYGKRAFIEIHNYLVECMSSTDYTDVHDICMAGFILKNTLSENGGVTRGICTVDGQKNLVKVTETYNIRYCGTELVGNDDKGNQTTLLPDQYVSMNMWGLHPSFLNELHRGFVSFLSQLTDDDVKTEYLLPQIIDRLLNAGQAQVKLLETNDKWFGITYKQDKQSVKSSINELISEGVYER